MPPDGKIRGVGLVCREIDSDNQRPLLFPHGFCMAFSPLLAWASGFPTAFLFSDRSFECLSWRMALIAMTVLFGE